MNEEILIKYLDNKLNKTDTKLVEAWIDLSEDNRLMISKMYEVLYLHDRLKAMDEFEVEENYQSFRKQVTNRIPKGKKKMTVLYSRIASISAVAIVLLLIGAVIAATLVDRFEKSLTVSTSLGERANVYLPDGSKVWLNACSNLEYKKSIFSRSRVAKIEGEAYFEIAQNRNMDFIVKNELSEIRVLGTSFNVKGNNDEDDLVVSLLEGSISFSDANMNHVRLIPGERLVYNKLNNELTIEKNISVDDVTAWLQGRIVFKDTQLSEMAKTLEKHYNVKINFSDDMVKRKRFTADFGMSDNIYQIFSILALTNAFEYTFEGREIIIKSKE